MSSLTNSSDKIRFREETVTLADQTFVRRVYVSGTGEIIGSELVLKPVSRQRHSFVHNPYQMLLSALTASVLIGFAIGAWMQ